MQKHEELAINIEIATFIGRKGHHEKDAYTFPYSFRKALLYKKKSTWFTEGELAFTRDWNWLMPAVKHSLGMMKDLFVITGPVEKGFLKRIAPTILKLESNLYHQEIEMVAKDIYVIAREYNDYINNIRKDL